jgi:hypothetical protein
MPDKTIVQTPVGKTDLKNISLLLEEGTKTWNATYIPKDDAGTAIGDEPRVISGLVTQDPGLWAWVDTVVVAAINGKEGTA